MKGLLLIAFGVLLVIAAGIWKFGLSDRYNQRFPDGWEWNISTLGKTAWADESGVFPEGTTLEDDPINITEREIAASSEGAPDGAVNINDHYATLDPATNAITWEFTFTAQVDQKTGKYLAEEYRDDYFLFPRNVEKATYHIRNTSYQGLPLEFQSEEEVSGISTYFFTYQADTDNSAAYSDVQLEEGQSIICYDLELSYWVEPKTGEVVKYREWCEGDYVIDSATGEKVYALSRWGGETTGDDLIRRVNEVQSELTKYNLVNLYIPLILLVGGLALIGGGAWTNRASGKSIQGGATQ